MGTVTSAVPKAVPTAVAPTASTSVAVDTSPQLGPYKPMTGSSVIPAVPTSGSPEEAPESPRFAGMADSGSPAESGAAGAPSVPALGGALFRAGPIDSHYQVQDQGGKDPYATVGRPVPRGMLTWVKSFANHVFNGAQNVNEAGWQQNSPQQRTSWMRVTPPPVSGDYDPEWFTPHQMPQQPNTYKYNPALGPGDPGTLNSATLGAGQTAGGEGGSRYTPAPGPPDTTSTAGAPQDASGMPTWG
jgi:hypothetical protein